MSSCKQPKIIVFAKVFLSWQQDVFLKAVDPKGKIKTIKEVRAATGLGLKEAKELVEKAPCAVKQGLSKEEADALAEALKAVGADVELK